MTWTLPITGEYPANWKEISDATCAAAGHRCIRCGHPYRKGEHGKGEWTPCGQFCNHAGPFGLVTDGVVSLIHYDVRFAKKECRTVYAQWRILTVHHFDGNKANCEWWNLLPLCQRCHLQIQTRVNPQQPYMFEHSDWLKPYVAGFYAWKYKGLGLTRSQIEFRLEQYLALERIA